MARIVIIDDEPTVLRVFELALGSEHDVIAASTCAAGLDAAPRADLIVADLNLPDCPGAVLEELRRAAPAVPMIAISGNITEDAERDAMRTGAATLHKPFGIAELRQSVRTALEDGSPGAEPTP